MHLDEERWNAILEGRTVPPDLAAHLEEDCPTCEAFLAERTESDALDGVVDDALFGVSEAKTDTPSELTYTRVERALRGPWRSAAVAVGVAVAIAAALLLMPRETTQNLKGPTNRPQLELELLYTADGEAPAPLAAGGTVPAGAAVLFRTTLDRPSCIGLWRGETRLLDDALCLDRGAHVLEQDGRPLGLTVRETGSTSFAIAPIERGPAPARAPPGATEVRVVVR